MNTLYLGSFGRDPKTTMGITAYRYLSETCNIEMIENYVPDLSIGQQCFDEKNGVLYAVNEVSDLKGRTGGGGYVLAFRQDRDTGKLTEISRCRTFGNNPCYVSYDNAREFLLVVHHGLSNTASTLDRRPDGSFGIKLTYDTATAVLYALEADGRIGELCDAVEIEGHDRYGTHSFPHLHSVVRAGDSDAFLVCDKGLDRRYVFTIDRENRKLAVSDTVDARRGTAPRYSYFNNRTGMFYSNCETEPVVYSFAYRPGADSITPTQAVALRDDGRGHPSDIAVSPDGMMLYVNVRDPDSIGVFSVAPDGSFKRIQLVEDGAEAPRGMAVSPDGRFLLACSIF